jgi:hypothetical protein
LRSKVLKYVTVGLLALVLLLVVVAAATYARLTQGPVSLAYFNDRIEQAIASELPDMKVKLGKAFLAIDPKTGVPQVRFNNILISDANGNRIASAPQAGVALDKTALLTGRISARNLELIGPHISARRNVDGSLELGVNGTGDEPQASAGSQTAQGKTEQVGAAAPASQNSGARLLQIFDQHDASNTLSALDDIRITDAELNFYDDANAASWFAPKADLTFQKKPYGFVVLAKADIATVSEPWHAEISATYRHDEKKFDISSTVDNLVPSAVARKIFALSQFAAVSTPLSGHVELGLNSAGQLLASVAEFQAKAGRITLPDFFAQPIAIDEGYVHVSYAPETGSFDLSNSTLVVGGRTLDLSGNVQPLRGADGKLTALGLKLATKAVAGGKSDAAGIAIDRIEFGGQASVDKARLDIDDLVIMSGNTGLRLRGNVTGGEKSPGIHIAGRVRDISSELLNFLWPPIVAPRTRIWVSENVVDGTIPEGTFQLNFDENALAQARINKRNPDGAVDFRFSLKDVTTHYFKSLPVLTKASGHAHLSDNAFTLDIDGGEAALESGEVVKLISGSFEATDLLADEVLGSFVFNLESPITAMLALASHPDVKIVKPDPAEPLPKAKGTARVKLGIKMPLIKDVPKERVDLTTELSVKDVEVNDLAPGIDLSNGDFAITLSPDKVDISGPAKINGQPAKISWSKPREGGKATAQFSATVDDKSREKMGINLSDYLNGPVVVDATMTKDQTGHPIFDVKADLASATMRLATLSWKRPPTDGTTATFHLVTTDQGRSVQDFKLDGPGLHLKGAIELTTLGKLKAVSMSEIKLDEDNVFSVRAIPGDGTTDLQITGTNLDARPYIKTIISPPPKPGEGSGGSSQSAQDFTLRAHFDKVVANRGEIINNVTANLRARAGRIAEANIQGTFINGQPVTATVVPLPTGREMRVKSGDAGSAMRAANFYSKIAGGSLDFYALIGNEAGSPLHNGILTIQDFDVRNEATLAELDKRGKPTKNGPRSESVSFNILHLPFSADDKFIRFKEATVRGPTMCATADGLIRKSDNTLDVAGTVIPACGLSRVLNNVPVIGDILSGGNYNEGIFGVTYAMAGTLTDPQIQMNPMSALAPGIFRRLFDFSPKSPTVDPNTGKPAN